MSGMTVGLFAYHGYISKADTNVSAIVGLSTNLELAIQFRDNDAHDKLINNIKSSPVLRSLRYDVTGDQYQTCRDLTTIITYNRNIRSIYLDMAILYPFVGRRVATDLINAIRNSNIHHIDIRYISNKCSLKCISPLFEHNKTIRSYALSGLKYFADIYDTENLLKPFEKNVLCKYTTRNRHRIGDYGKLSLMILGMSRQRTSNTYDIKSHKYLILMIAKCVYSLRYMRDKKYNNPIWR